jgi:uracil-DNA glycosylase
MSASSPSPEANSRRDLARKLRHDLRACRTCLEAGHAITPGAIFSHPAPSPVMLIGQAPGVTEVEAQRPFNAGSGRRLFSWLEQAGWHEDEFRRRYVMTAVTKCYPGKGKNGKGDRVPSKKEQRFCRPFLEREIRLFKPRLLILVGGLAIKLYYPARMKLVEIIGTAAYFPRETLTDPLNFDLDEAELMIDFDSSKDRNGRWVVPLPHPSGASLWPNRPRNKRLIDRALEILAQLRLNWKL